MIFKPQLARAVASGKKTQTRRPVKSDKPCRYKVGNDYSVQPGRGKEGIARIKVLDVREERVGQITHRDAKAEGFRNVVDFRRYWLVLYDGRWLAEMEGDDDWLPDPLVNVRFEARHAHKLVTVISFELVQDTPRFLAHPTPNSGDYTEQRHRAIDDLEVVDDLTQERYAKKAREEGERQRASFKRDLERERALRKAERGRSMRLAPYARRAA